MSADMVKYPSDRAVTAARPTGKRVAAAGDIAVAKSAALAVLGRNPRRSIVCDGMTICCFRSRRCALGVVGLSWETVLGNCLARLSWETVCSFAFRWRLLLLPDCYSEYEYYVDVQGRRRRTLASSPEHSRFRRRRRRAVLGKSRPDDSDSGRGTKICSRPIPDLHIDPRALRCSRLKRTLAAAARSQRASWSAMRTNPSFGRLT